MEINKVYNEDCNITMSNMVRNNFKVGLILTSPPYNTGIRKEYYTNKIVDGKRIYSKNKRYDSYNDNLSEDEYLKWSIALFNKYDNILQKNGVILYNISYGNENPNILWLLIADIIKNTNFMIADCIIWKKSTALPNSTSKNKLTRICVFVIVRKNEYKTFNSNKKIINVSSRGQNFYEVFYNYIEAKNNDGSNSLNKATFSGEFVQKLLNMYATKETIVYDSFSGIGTTFFKCKELGIDFIGSELSADQCNFIEGKIGDYK